MMATLLEQLRDLDAASPVPPVTEDDRQGLDQITVGQLLRGIDKGEIVTISRRILRELIQELEAKK
jgi:hypothetical protein